MEPTSVAMTSSEDIQDNESTATMVRPPRKLSRPKITLKMPSLMTQTMPTIYSATPGIRTIPLTPAAGLPPNFGNFPNLPNYPPVNLFQAYPHKAQEFMFKQFRGFKDFTMNTGKVGLSFGEKSVFWAYGRVRQLSTNSFTHIMLFFVIMLYCLIGGFIFYFLESGSESKRLEDFNQNMESRIASTVSAICAIKNCTLTERVLVKDNIMEYTNFLKENSLFGKTPSWDLPTSILFCGTVFTTIGYGHLAPTTHFGRIATIIYSLFGIPMFLILLADYGKLFTRSIKYVWAFVRRLYYTGSCRKVRRTGPVQEVMKGMQMMYGMTRRRSKDQNMSAVPVTNIQMQIPQTASPTCTPAMSSYTIDDQFNLPISVAFVILLIYMIAGAGFFSYTENWEFLDAFYFVYISTSTIGFGDLVPKSQMVFMMVSLVYFVFGLALTSMCINVVQEKLSDSFKQATAKLGATIGFEVDDNGTPMVLQYEGTEPVEQMNVAIPSNDEVEE